MNRQLISIITMLALVAVLIIGIGFTACTSTQENGKMLFITGSYGALNRGAYDGDVTVANLKQQGDFALGTFSSIDGELLGLNGNYYKIGAQGKISQADNAWTTPFATVTFFKSDKVISLDKPLGYQEMQEYINSQLPTPNVFFAIKLTGKFDSIKARSLTRLNKPYPSTPYSVITQNEPTFEFNNVDGTLAITVSPTYCGEISYPGYHAHFINADGQYGGHVLDCRIASGQAEVTVLPNFTVNLLQNAVFYQADFTKAR